MNKNKIKSTTQEICPTHLVEKIKLFTGCTTPSGEWEEAYYCLLDTNYLNPIHDQKDRLISYSGMTGICITPMGKFRDHSPLFVSCKRHFFSPDEEYYICIRCGQKHTNLSEGGGGGSF